MNVNQTIGVDIVEVDRFNGLIEKTHFINKIYTKKEIEYCLSKNKNDKIQSFAVRFAAKEAIKKSLNDLIDYNKIEVIPDKTGRPIVNFLDNKIKNIYQSVVSLSHTPQFAVASCLTYNIKRVDTY